MGESEIQTRERLSRLEEKIDFVLKDQAVNSLKQEKFQEKQMEKISSIADSVLLMRPAIENLNKVSEEIDEIKSDIHTIKTEKALWHKILYPFTGVISATIVHYFKMGK